MVDATDVTAVTRREGSIHIERRGWRLGLTIDTDDLDEPVTVAAALSRWSGTPVRPS